MDRTFWFWYDEGIAYLDLTDVQRASLFIPISENKVFALNFRHLKIIHA